MFPVPLAVIAGVLLALYLLLSGLVAWQARRRGYPFLVWLLANRNWKYARAWLRDALEQ
jgi:hypothetical protein